MNLGTHVPDGERRKPIDNEVYRTKVKATLSIRMFATRLSHLWCVTDFHYNTRVRSNLFDKIMHEIFIRNLQKNLSLSGFFLIEGC